MRRIGGILTICFLVFAPRLPAEEFIATFDPSASEISFVLQATAHQVRGAFPLQSGEVRWNSETGAASGEIVVSVQGGQTGNLKRDEKMHDQVLESSQFPQFSFRAERLEGDMAAQGASALRLVGTLSVHGSEHPLTIDAEVVATSGRLDAVASFPVPYVDWGLSDPSAFVLRVAKSATVTVELSGTLRVAERQVPEDG